MKTLYIVRHAKSSWDEDVIDHRRPLNKKGKYDVLHVSEYVASHFKKPDIMISSDANRALTTALAFKNAFQMAENNFFAKNNMYDFSGENVLEEINACSDNVRVLMLFGHNHALTHLVNQLGNQFLNNLPTCGFVQIDFQTDSWENLTNGKTIATIFPKDLK
ncbi:MAG: histidine phosphatase family protein [Flavobacteriales bacterium]|nr:histidine phosphatase family protein [Flavobacteriales bacterium]